MKINSVYQIAFSCFVLTILASCAVEEITRNIMPTDIPNPTSSLVTLQPIETVSITSTPFELSLPTEEEITSTPSAPLTLAEKTKKVKDLLGTNGGCALPCWWGITPGLTLWKNAHDLLEPLSLSLAEVGTKAPDELVYYLTFPNPATFNSSQADLKITVFVQNRIVQEVDVEIMSYGPYSRPQTALQVLGKPSKIFLGGEINPYERTHYFEIAYYYPERGVLSIYGNRQDIPSNPILQVCFDSLRFNALYLWSPEKSFGEEMKLIFENSGIKFLSIQDATSQTTENIFSAFTTTNNQCVNTPAELWPGYLK